MEETTLLTAFNNAISAEHACSYLSKEKAPSR
jgi:hypothetical protein